MQLHFEFLTLALLIFHNYKFMKKYLFLVLPVLLLSCGESKQEKSDEKAAVMADSITKSENTLQALIDANIHNQPEIDTAFLGFTFGMTKKQAIDHYNELVKGKKLIKDERNHYVYPMAFELVKAKAAIAPEFNNDKLYKISLVIMPDQEDATNETVYLQAAATYMKKYSDYKMFKEANALDGSNHAYHFIKNNLQIFLHENVDGAVAEYINMPVAEEMKKQDNTTADSSKAQTKKDI